MEQIQRIGIAIILIGICTVAIYIIYLFVLTPKEKYPKDTYLKYQQKRSALIIIAHDDDAATFSVTTSLLAANGWDISFMCFYNDFCKPEKNPIRKL